MAAVIIVLWPVISGAFGAWFARAAYDRLWFLLLRARRFRRAERAMARAFGRGRL